jgi:hypothetical protein
MDNITAPVETVNPVLARAWRDVTELASAFFETMDRREQIEALTALQRFVAAFPTDEQLEAVAFFISSFPGFKSFMVEWSVRETAYLDCERAAQAVAR